MMISRETDLNKQETSAAAAWSRLNDPRIVRVSKAFGGKDRHSKVCTVRGLRDRRMRLSVPTAIQLYDLQDRLGLNQPSKVVDWLLNAAKHEIDELPPLEFPPGSFQAMVERSTQVWSDPLKGQKSGFLEGKLSEEAASDEEGNDERRFSLETDQNHAYVSDNSFARQGSSSLSGMLNPSSVPYNPFVRWDPPNLSLSHPPRSDGLTAAQPDHDWHSIGLLPMSAAAATGSHQQVLVYQPGISSTQSYFQATDSEEMSFRGDSNESTAVHQSYRPMQFTTTANLLHLHNGERDDEHNKGSI